MSGFDPEAGLEGLPEDLPQTRESVEYIRTLGKPMVREVLRDADLSRQMLVQPRCGVGSHEGMMRLLSLLEKGAAPEILTLTIDSYTRLRKFGVARHLIDVNPGGLNGYPLVGHGWRKGREINASVKTPLQVRHGSPDPRVLFEVAIASGITAFEGGGIGYNLPYCKDIPLEHSLRCWQEVDRRCGELARQGVLVDRELFGTLTAVLIPPAIGLSMTLLEAILAVREGVKCVSIACCQGGNLIQDVAALRAIRRMAARYLPADVEVYPVFHEWMGPFSPDRRTADATIFYGALTAWLGRATKLINKTYEEALGIPSVEANVTGIWTARAATSALFDFIRFSEDEVEAEIESILDEVDEIVAPVVDAAEPIAAIARAFQEGRLDIPFSASRHARSEVLPMRDASGAIRFFKSGGLGFSEKTRARNDALLSVVLRSEGFDLFQKLRKDIMYFSKVEQPTAPLLQAVN